MHDISVLDMRATFCAVMRLAAACCVVAPQVMAQRAFPAAVRPLASLDSAWATLSRTFYDTQFVRGRGQVVHDSLRLVLGTDATDAAVRGAIRFLIAMPGQSHMVLIPGDAVPEPDARDDASRPHGTAGIELRVVDDSVVVWRVAKGSAGDRAGVRVGAVVTQIGDLFVDSVRARLRRAISVQSSTGRELMASMMMSRLAGGAGDSVAMRIVDGGRARVVALVRGPVTGRTTQFGNLPPIPVEASMDSTDVQTSTGARRVPVLRWSAWFPVISADLDRMLFAARGAPALIIDLRGNPGGAVGMLTGVTGHFTDSAVSLGTLHGRGSTLQLRANPRRVTPAGERVLPFAGPIAILVDALTASTSEFFAAGMQAIGRARVFGERSAGQALPAAMMRLPNGDVLMHPIADHEDARGRRVEGRGVQPDDVVPLRRNDLIAGHDATLDAARRWLTRTLP